MILLEWSDFWVHHPVQFRYALSANTLSAPAYCTSCSPGCWLRVCHSNSFPFGENCYLGLSVMMLKSVDSEFQYHSEGSIIKKWKQLHREAGGSCRYPFSFTVRQHPTPDTSVMPSDHLLWFAQSYINGLYWIISHLRKGGDHLYRHIRLDWYVLVTKPGKGGHRTGI